MCVPKSESNRGASKVVVVNTTSGWPRPHRLLFFRPPSCGLSSSILSGPSFSTFLSTSPILPRLLSLSFHHHTGPVHFSLSCLFSKFCHLTIIFTSLFPPLRNLDGSSCMTFAPHILSSPHTHTRFATCLGSLATIAKPDWYPTPQEPRRECN